MTQRTALLMLGGLVHVHQGRLPLGRLLLDFARQLDKEAAVAPGSVLATTR